jgi:hypothetical protein
LNLIVDLDILGWLSMNIVGSLWTFCGLFADRS